MKFFRIGPKQVKCNILAIPHNVARPEPENRRQQQLRRSVSRRSKQPITDVKRSSCISNGPSPVPIQPVRWPQGSSQGSLSVTITEGAASGWLHHHLPAVYQRVGVALAVGGGRVQTEGGRSALQRRAVAYSVQRRQGTVQLTPLQHARSSNSTV